MLLSKCAVKSRFIREQQASILLSSLGSLETTLSKISLLGNNLFWMQFHWVTVNAR